jgi:D-arabinose 1-dehydrogenase-like Zn-dependent alcohol dehydrogenase
MSQMRAVQVSKANGPFECGICHSDSFTKMAAFPGIKLP